MPSTLFSSLVIPMVLIACGAVGYSQEVNAAPQEAMPRLAHPDLKAMAKKLNIAFTVEDVETPQNLITTRGFGSSGNFGTSPKNAPTRDDLAAVTSIENAVRLTEALYPGYIVALAPAETYTVRVLHIINRNLIADTPMHRPLSDFTFEGTLRSLATTVGTNPAFFGIIINSETYAYGSGSALIVLDDSRPVKVDAFNGNMRNLFTMSALACKPQAFVLWKSITGKSNDKNTPVRIEMLPDGGGDRLR